MLGELTNHLWQSTVFAAAAGLMTLGFRKNRARVRYWLWLSASFKFLLPFALLMSLGNRLAWAPANDAMPAASSLTFSVMQMSRPFPEAFAPAPSAPASLDRTAVALFGAWACGFGAIALTRVRGWRRIRAAVRSSQPIDNFGGMQVRSSASLLEPGVVGLFRPILLLPAGLWERLAAPQLEAVLAHELCHVRRRDNLTAAIHMLVEAVFWFHPLVWWIGARLVEERERACDEAVLSLGNEPRDYAEGLLTICKSYLESPLSCVSGVTGSNLKRRIQAILMGRIAPDLSFAKKTVLVIAAALAITMPVAMGIASAPAGRTKLTAATKFEAASIKPCQAFRKGTFPMWSPGMELHSQCTTMQRLIEQAYGLFAAGHWNPASSLTVIGGPAWIASELYEVDAKAASPQNRAMVNGPMLQALLEDRLQLKVHRETRKSPVYALTIAHDGPKLETFQGSCRSRDFDERPSETDCAAARGYGGGFRMKAATITDLCTGLSVLLDRRVVDQTGTAGRFNMRVDLSKNRALLNRPRALPAVSDPTTPMPPPVPFEAAKIAMNKLGLNLAPAEAPGEFLIIDHVARPSGK